MNDMAKITPSQAAAILGSLSRGKTSPAKKAAARANWKKAEAKLRETRWKKIDAVATEQCKVTTETADP